MTPGRFRRGAQEPTSHERTFIVCLFCEDEMERPTLGFPQDGGHLMLFSFKGHSELAVRERLLNPLRSVHGRDREKAASRVILENCANFAVNPGVHDACGERQRRAIREYFWDATAMEQARLLGQNDTMYRVEMEALVKGVVGDPDPADPRIDLFEAAA